MTLSKISILVRSLSVSLFLWIAAYTHILLHFIQFKSRSLFKFELNVNSVVNLCTPIFLSPLPIPPSLALYVCVTCYATLNRCWRLSIYTGICRYFDKIILSHLFAPFRSLSLCPLPFVPMYSCSHFFIFSLMIRSCYLTFREGECISCNRVVQNQIQKRNKCAVFSLV